MLTKKHKEKVIKKTQSHVTDTGSAAVQRALLEARIGRLTEHLKQHRKDKHSRRGLLGLVAKRRRHEKYLEKKKK